MRAGVLLCLSTESTGRSVPIQQFSNGVRPDLQVSENAGRCASQLALEKVENHVFFRTVTSLRRLLAPKRWLYQAHHRGVDRHGVGSARAGSGVDLETKCLQFDQDGLSLSRSLERESPPLAETTPNYVYFRAVSPIRRIRTKKF